MLDPGEEHLKVPDWLNDVTLYHNRGDTTFTGENSQYGDFFGLDDLFTENPKVVQGMIDIYEKWIADFGVDGFRIDTMKHVDDAFWQRFGPEVLAYARTHGKRQFFMFGEVFDTTKSFTSQYVTHNKMQAVLDFPFQAAAQGFAADSKPTDALRDFFEGDDWYTDADSNVYQLPTFLGNHDMGRIGRFIDVANPDASDGERLKRDELAHALMYLSRGNPVVYYGDEQGFTGDGGDQLARQDMFPSQVAAYNDDDLIGTDATTAVSNFDPAHPLYAWIAQLAKLRNSYPALDDGAQQHRWSSPEPGVYAFSRIDRSRRREFVVAVNNAKTAQTATVPTYARRGQQFTRVWGESAKRVTAGTGGGLEVVVPALSAVVYRMNGHIAKPSRAPRLALEEPAPASAARGRMEVTADVDGDSFYEVTFQARVGNGGWEAIGTDDNAPYRVLHDVSDIAPGTQIAYRAVVRTLGGRTRASEVQTAEAPAAAVTLTAPSRGRGSIPLSAVVDPEHADDVVTFQRRVGGGDWTDVGTDSSSPAYTFNDDVSSLGLEDGAVIEYRAVLAGTAGPTVTSEARSVELVLTPVTTAVLHYLRPAGDYDGWGLHLFGNAVDPALLATVAWDKPMPPTAIEPDGWARFDIPLISDTAAVNYIIHQPSGDSVPTTREPGGDRSFVPLQTPEVWVVQGDPTIYPSPPAAARARARGR